MGNTKPQPRILMKWRINLALFMLIPAFLIALLFPVASRVWIILCAAWLVAFLGMYLVYLPLRYRGLSFTVEDDRILLYSGVLYTRVRCIPLRNVQFTTIHRSFADYVAGLCSLAVTSAGGRAVLPGLRPWDAEALSASLTER